MKTVIRRSYKPKLGDYCNTFVVDKETGNQYFFDRDGVWMLISTDEEGIIAEAVAQANAYTDDVAEEKVDKEEGKGLSENDFTDALKNKLDGIEPGAQENVIEVVKVNGSALTVTDKTVNVVVPTDTSDLTNGAGFVTKDVDNLTNYYTSTQTDNAIAAEADLRAGADTILQRQIDAIVASSDVVDIVGTYADLQNYDTTKLHNNDIVKVLSDESRDGATTYYRWSTSTSEFNYIGSEGPYYTKSESDSTFVPQTRTINSKALSSDITLTAQDVGALPNSTVIPTVNDATLTIQKNGTTVTTFTANSATNTTANISVPTKTSDITNDGADGTSTYVEADNLATVATTGAYSDLTGKPSVPTKTSDLTNDSNFVSDANYVHTDNNFTTALKDKLDGIEAGAEANVQSDWNQTNNSADDYIKNKPNVPTKVSDLTNDAGYITSAAVPTKVSDLQNDTGFITSSVNNLSNYYNKSETYTQTEVNGLFNALSIPTKTSDLTNDGSDGTSTYVEADQLATVAMSGSYNDLSNKPTIPAAQVNSDWNAASGVAQILNKPTLATVATTGSYNDLTDKPADFELVEMSYGESNAWAKFIAAYQGHKIVYCRASSNSNPATGSQTRKAFMAYVNNADTPTEVEFQYVRSVSSKTSSQPVDQVFVYKLTNASGGTWTVQARDMGPKLASGTNANVSYSNGTYTISATQPTVNDATLTIQKNGINVATFTANASSNVTANIAVPIATSDLTNDSGFITSITKITNAEIDAIMGVA